MKYRIPSDFTRHGTTVKHAPLKYAPYSQAYVARYYNENGELYRMDLISYNTLVACVLANGVTECTGTYSQTTRRHINRFCREVNEDFNAPLALNYSVCKQIYENDMLYNIFTGECTPIYTEEEKS